MKMLKIAALPNGAHINQDYHGKLPEGWAVVPADIEMLENFPFGEVEVEEIDGVPTVVKWTPGTLPEPDQGTEQTAEPAPTLDDRVATLETNSAEMAEALDLLLSGVTE